MGKSDSDSSAESSEDVNIMNITPTIENYSRTAYDLLGVLLGKVRALEVESGMHSDECLLKQLEGVMKHLGNDSIIAKSLFTTKVKLKTCQEIAVRNKGSIVASSPEPKRRKCTVQVPSQNELKTILDIIQKIVQFATAFETKAKFYSIQELGSASKKKFDRLEKEVDLCIETLEESRDQLKGVVENMKKKTNAESEEKGNGIQ